MSNSMFAVDLRYYMDLIYGAGNWSNRTGIGTGSDIAPALHAALDEIRASGGRGIVLIPAGPWLLNGPIDPVKLSGNKIQGVGSQGSKIVYNNGSGAAFHFSGANGYTGGGLSGLAIQLESGYPASTAYAVMLDGDSTYQPDQTVFDDLYITAYGTSNWRTGFFAYGNERTSPQGIRCIQATNIQIFKCQHVAVWLSNIVQGSIDNIGAYSGATDLGNSIYVAGGGNSQTNTVQLSLTRLACGKDLNLTNASNLDVSGICGSLSVGSSLTRSRICVAAGSVIGSPGPGVLLNTF